MTNYKKRRSFTKAMFYRWFCKKNILRGNKLVSAYLNVTVDLTITPW